MEPTKHFRKRDAILSCLRGTTVHPSADWVFQQLRPQFPDLSLGTVYRNLSRFRAMGQIVSLGTVKGVERFDGDTSPHVHYICTDCGSIVDLPSIAVPQELSFAAAECSGGEVTGCCLTFTGLCGQCQNQSKGEST